MTAIVTLDITYAELRDGDHIQANGAWLVSRTFRRGADLTFDIDSIPPGKHYSMRKPANEGVTVTRFDAPQPSGPVGPMPPAAVADALGASSLVEVTDADQAVADASTEAAPTVLPRFESWEDPRVMVSHLFVYHGLSYHPRDPRAKLVADHTEAHAQQAAGTITAPYIPHVHTEGAGS